VRETVTQIWLFAPSDSVRVFTVSESHQSPGPVITRPSKERPSGVAILAVFFFIYGASQGVGALAEVPILFLGGGGGMLIYPVHALVFLSMIAFSLGKAALLVAIGIGIFRLQNWARILLMVFIGLELLMAARALVFSASRALPALLFSPGPALIVGSIVVGVLVYLFRPHVKQAFGAIRF
jgi:hypothetical protein